MGLLAKIVLDGEQAWHRIVSGLFKPEELRELWRLVIQGLEAEARMERMRRLPRL